MKKVLRESFLITIAIMSFIICGLTACDNKSKESVSTVFLVPLDGVSEKQMLQLKSDLEKNFFDKEENRFIIDTLGHQNSPKECLNKAKTRLWAKSMVNFLKSQYSEAAESKAKENAKLRDMKYKDWYVIGVTNRDISTDFPGKEDYGIMGLSFRPNGKASIISTYRLRNKKDDLWKLAVHEFGHGYYNLPHCQQDIDTCLMQDAKHGNPHYELKEAFCFECKNITNSFFNFLEF